MACFAEYHSPTTSESVLNDEKDEFCFPCRYRKRITDQHDEGMVKFIVLEISIGLEFLLKTIY